MSVCFYTMIFLLFEKLFKNRYALLVVLGLMISIGSMSRASAQTRYDTVCLETNAKGRNHCLLHPTKFTDWVYRSGIPSGTSFPTVQEVVESTIAFWIRGAERLCSVTHEVGPEEIVAVDNFIQSRQSVRTRNRLLVKISVADTAGRCLEPTNYGADIWGDRATQCTPFAEAYFADINSSGCMASTVRYPMACDLCNAGKVGNPIVPSIREKVEVVKDLPDERPHALEFTRIYRSHRVRDAVLWFGERYENLNRGDMGVGWLHNHEFNLAYTRVRKDDGGAFDQVRIQMPDGSHQYFHRKNGGAYIARNALHSLNILPAGGWVFDDAERERQYIFNRKGRIVRQVEKMVGLQNIFIEMRPS